MPTILFIPFPHPVRTLGKQAHSPSMFSKPPGGIWMAVGPVGSGSVHQHVALQCGLLRWPLNILKASASFKECIYVNTSFQMRLWKSWSTALWGNTWLSRTLPNPPAQRQCSSLVAPIASSHTQQSELPC